MGRTLTWLLLVLGILLFIAGLTIHIATYWDLSLVDSSPFLAYVFLLGLILFGVVMADAACRTQARGKVPLFTAFSPIARSRAEAVAMI